MTEPVVIKNATLYLGDARDIVPGLQFDSVCSDPPYGMAFQSNHRETQHRAIANDHNEELLLWACGLTPPPFELSVLQVGQSRCRAEAQILRHMGQEQLVYGRLGTRARAPDRNSPILSRTRSQLPKREAH